MRGWGGPWTQRLAVAVLAAGAASCRIGEGEGKVTGQLQVMGCYEEPVDGSKNLVSTPERPFNLGARFFVGEPVDSPSTQYFPHMLLIRIQNAGSRPEFSDLVGFYLVDLYEVGRCVAGRTDPVTGAQDWNPNLCDRTTGAGRVLVGMESEVARAHVGLNRRCPLMVDAIPYPSAASADALGRCDGGTCPSTALCPGNGSWITFAQLGGIRADSGVAVVQSTFKVNFNERIRASDFHLEVCDSRTISAVQGRRLPVPIPRTVGTLDGYFDFDLERGQAGQPFP